ncbi:MAG: hypothetical protein C4567_07685 [Deltaproteobacteria bacterium]|nr:MAG: hypothetical protein C4567_07685 [Deltaproteobacteria bacterium]
MTQGRPQEALIREIARLQEMAREWARLFPQAVSQGEHWLKVLDEVRGHVSEDTCRLAVVGAVKSGKSTAINALLGQDVLKRGAGILTAMVTRIQPGPEPGAVLKFKEWPEINGEINRALGLLPVSRLKERAAPLDLQQAADRELLFQVLAEARQDDIWTEGSLDPNYLLLKSYLEGFDQVQGLLRSANVLSLAGPDLARHRDMVTREATAVFLKDVLLTVPFPWPAAGLEFGDCQGSDSPFPQHLAQVLAYLVKSDLALYVVSSRVGLRQADFQFLGELNRMGLLPHLHFILNLDLGEHASLEEARQIRDRVARELAPWQPEPRVYAFSALKLLLDRRRSSGETLDQREAGLLSVWALDQAAAAFSGQEAARFQEDLLAAVQRLQSRRLAGGSLSQVQMVALGLKEQLELTLGLLGRDLEALQKVEGHLQARRQPLESTLDNLDRTLNGAGMHLKKVLKDRVNSVMDRRYGKVGSALTGFIRDYEPNWDRLLLPEAPGSFRPALYQLFQECVRELTQYVTAEANVSLVEFIREQEGWLRSELIRVETPLLLSLQDALTLYYREIEALGFPAAAPALEMAAPPRPSSLEVPLLNLQLDPGWWLDAEVWVRSGAGFLERYWEAVKRRLGLKNEADPRQQLLRDLGRALKSVKEWLLEQVKVQVIDYEERLKFQYFLPLVDQWLKQQETALANTMKSLITDLEGVAGSMQLAEEERAARRRRLEELLPEAKSIETHLEEMRQQ